MPRGHILDLRWNALLNDFRRSGLTQAEFCERRGISIHSFRKRLYRVPTPKPTPANHPSPNATTHFLPVTVLPDPIPATAAVPTAPRAAPGQWTPDRRRTRLRSPHPPPTHRRRRGATMFGLSAAVRVYLAKDPADMRKSFDGLSALVAGPLELDPLSGHLFVFLNKRRDRIKILYWDRDGLAVWAKRLENGTFRIPQATAGRIEMTTADLAALLAGIDLDTARRRRRYTRPLTPLQNSEKFAPTNEHAST